MRVSVIGCGYLGAVHAASMAELGHDVVGIDVDAAKIATLADAKAPFYEPGFEELLERTLATGRLLEPEDDGPPVRITALEIVISTEDGGELRVPLVHRHGAWWAP